AGAFAELEKARIVDKLRHARERKRRGDGRCEGRKPLAGTHPQAGGLAKRLRGARPQTGGRGSFAKNSAELAAVGYLNERGRPFNPKSVRAMIEGPTPSAIGPRR